MWKFPLFPKQLLQKQPMDAEKRRDLRVTPFSAANSYLSLLSLDAPGFAPDASIPVTLYGGAGGIRTLETLLTPTRFPIVLVMTASILLQLWWALRDSNPGPSGYEPDALTN